MIEFFNKYIFGIAVPTLLILAGIFYSVILKAFHIRHPSIILKALIKKNNTSGTSPFRALTLALAGTLGVGNIVGVASAIALGGFGSIFWMWVSALCAMLLKYAEILLAMKHRAFDSHGDPHGAAMYYIKAFFSSLSLKNLGKIVAAVFAFLCILNALTMGSMMQSNAISESLEGVFSISPIISGIIMSIICLLIISKGSDILSRITEFVIPLASLGYIAVSVAALFIQKEYLSESLEKIFSDAFCMRSASGGLVGFLTSRALRFGTIRGLISNEAGCGTAPTAHSTSNSSEPVEQGFFGIFEVFVDTIVLCTMTALVVIINFDKLKFKGSWIMLTIDAYSNALGSFAAIFLGISVLCFGFSTIICWAHYGIESLGYFTTNKYMRNIFIILYSSFVFAGALFNSKIIWDITDFAIGGMTIINVSVVCGMSKSVKKETERYLSALTYKKREKIK